MTAKQRRKRMKRFQKHNKMLMKMRRAYRIKLIATRLLGGAVLNLQSITDLYGKVTFIELP